MLYEPYQYEEELLFTRSLEIALLSFRASKSLHSLEDPWLAGELRSAALGLCEQVADGLRRKASAPDLARERFSDALRLVARLESLWLTAASLGQLNQESLRQFRQRLDGPLTLLGEALRPAPETPPEAPAAT